MNDHLPKKAGKQVDVAQLGHHQLLSGSLWLLCRASSVSQSDIIFFIPIASCSELSLNNYNYYVTLKITNIEFTHTNFDQFQPNLYSVRHAIQRDVTLGNMCVHRLPKRREQDVCFGH
jgi:hypothetical protein